jgi:hypothetical protein
MELLSDGDKEVHGGGDGGVLETRGGLGRCCQELFKMKGEDILLMCNAFQIWSLQTDVHNHEACSTVHSHTPA